MNIHFIFRKEKLTKELIDDMVDFALHCMESCKPELFVLGKVVADKAQFNIKVRILIGKEQKLVNTIFLGM